MKKLQLTVLCLVSLLLFISAGKYKSDGFFYTMELPKGWDISDDSDPSQVIFSKEGEDAAVVVGVFALESGTTSEELLQAVIDRMRMKGKKEAIQFKGYNAISGNFSFVMNGTKLIADVIIFNTRTCYFMIMGSSLKDTYNANRDALRVILSSFSLNGEALDAAYSGSSKDGGKTASSDTTTVEDSRGKLYTIRINWEDFENTFTFIEPDYYTAVKEGRDIIASGNLWAFYNVDPVKDPNYTGTFWSRFFQDMYNKNYRRVANMVEWFKLKAQEKRWSAYDLASQVVKCVQVIPYERPYQIISDDTQVASILDYFTPNEIAWYNKGDCDTKSMLIIMILRQLGYDAVLYFSEYYQHAMAGININATGTYRMHNGKKYYFVEATYPGWNIGDLPPDFGDPDKWSLVVLQ